MPPIPDIQKIDPVLNQIPQQLHCIHLMGICGTGMASLAGILQQKGYKITGSDRNIYPPMSLFLEGLSIPVMEGYQAENLDQNPDLVIVGNVITRDNPEAVRLVEAGLPYLSFPQAIKHFILPEKRSIVISGTHGKTTTSSISAWALEESGLAPSFMIGGIPLNFQSGFKLGKGPYVVIEGDEYDTAFFDKGPKFLHYDPWIVILTSIEFDHADIYRDLDHIISSFRKLLALIPEQGYLIANIDDPVVKSLTAEARCRVRTYSLTQKAYIRGTDIDVEGSITKIKITRDDKPFLEVATPIYGHHNLSNLLAAVSLADCLDLSAKVIKKAFITFKGVKRRQEIIGEKRNILILDDFAHHPTAVRKTIFAVREKYKKRRLIAIFEPRSNTSRRNIFQQEYATAFNHADRVMIPEPPLIGTILPVDKFSSSQLVEDLLGKGIKASCFQDSEAIFTALKSEVKSGDVVLFMSNGSFGNLPGRLLESLA